jgi:hypothetical protein
MWKVTLHERLRLIERGKPELRIQAMSVGGGQRETPEALQFGMGNNSGHYRLAVTLAAVFRQNEDVYEVGKGGVIGDDPGEGNLRGAKEASEAE